MSQFSLPLDSAALDRLEDKDLDRVRESAYQDLIEQGRAALVLRDELASRSRVSAQHATHHDDCGCLTARYEARIATLESALLARHGGEPLALLDELTEAREKVATLEAELASSRECVTLLGTYANALRDALEGLTKCVGYAQAKSRYGPLFGTKCLPAIKAADAALLATPAASLRSHDAEVLERAAAECETVVDDRPRGVGGQTISTHPVAQHCANLIRALAAQEVAK